MVNVSYKSQTEECIISTYNERNPFPAVHLAQRSPYHASQAKTEHQQTDSGYRHDLMTSNSTSNWYRVDA